MKSFGHFEPPFGHFHGTHCPNIRKLEFDSETEVNLSLCLGDYDLSVIPKIEEFTLLKSFDIAEVDLASLEIKECPMLRMIKVGKY